MGMWSDVREAAGLGPSRAVAVERLQARAEATLTEARTYVAEGGASMMARLSNALDERGWIKVDGFEQDHDRLSVEAIRAAAQNATALGLGNPIMARAVQAQYGYVWGGGVRFSGLGRLEKSPSIRANLTDTDAQQQLEFDKATTGNVFVFIGDDKTVQRIPFHQITGVVTNPIRSDEVFYYLREWEVVVDGTPGQPNARTRKIKRLYRASSWTAPREWDYDQRVVDAGEDGGEIVIVSTPRVIDDVEIDTSGVLYHKAWHRQTGGVWGISELLSGIFYATEHKELIEAGDSVWRAQSQYAVQVKAKTRRGLEAVAASIAGPAPTDPATDKPMQYGNTLGTGADVEMQLMQKIGAGIDFGSFEPIANLASIGTGIPVAIVLGKEEPNTTLPFTTKQTMQNHARGWRDFYRDVFELLGKPSARAEFPKIDPDPTFRQMQTIAGVVSTKLVAPKEGRELIRETLGKYDWPEDLPDPEDWAEFNASANPIGSTEVTGQGDGPITGGQGQTGQVGKLSDGDHSLRDQGQQAHTQS